MLFRRIVIGLDFRSPSLAAARFAVRRVGAPEFVFVHVLAEVPGHRPDPLADTRDAQLRLREIANALHVVAPDFDVIAGSVADELCLAGEYVEADLLCIGAPSHESERPGSDIARWIVRRSSVSTLIVPTSARIGPVYAVWSGQRDAVVLRTASAIAEHWGSDLNALCLLDEGHLGGSDHDGVEQRQLAQLLQQADVAGVETMRVDVQRHSDEAIDSLVAFVQPELGGMLVCDAEIASVLLDRGATANSDVASLRRLLSEMPLLAVAAPLNRGGVRRLRRHESTTRTAAPRHPKPPPDGGNAA